MFLLKKKSIYRLTLFSSWPQHRYEWRSWRDPAADTVSSAGCLPSVARLTEVRFQRDNGFSILATCWGNPWGFGDQLKLSGGGPCMSLCSAEVEPLRGLGCLVGSSLLGRWLSPVPVTVQSSLPLASSRPRDFWTRSTLQGRGGRGWVGGVLGRWAFYTSWPRWVLGLSGECTSI